MVSKRGGIIREGSADDALLAAAEDLEGVAGIEVDGG